MAPHMSAECGKGWRARCAASKGTKCRCRCGGANHGRARTDERMTREGGARYRIEETATDAVVIRDLGPWDRHKTVTNDAEAVVEQLASMLGDRRLFYYDSLGTLDELAVVDGKFAGFRSLAGAR